MASERPLITVFWMLVALAFQSVMQVSYASVDIASSGLLPGKHTPYVVAFAQDNLKDDFRRAQLMEVKHELSRHHDIQFFYSDALGKTPLLIHHINQFIHQQVDVLIVGTNDARLVVPVIEKAHERGIKVLILDRGVETSRFTSFLNSDNVLVGRMAGRFIAEELGGKGQVLLMEGLKAADVTYDRTKGFMDVVTQYPDIKVIKRTGNYLRKDALLEMEKLLAEGIRVDAIFSESDSMLSGIRAVLSRRDIDPASIISVGCDFTREAREAILNGDQTGSVRFPLGGIAAAKAVLDLKSGKPLPYRINIPVDTLVTQDNVNQVKPIF